MVKKHTRRSMNQERIPGAAWDCVFSWLAEVLSHLAFAIAQVSKTYSATRRTYRTFYTLTSTSPSTTWSKLWPFPRIISFWAVGLVRRTTSVRRYATGS